MKKKLIFGLMLIFSLSFVVVGCGDSDSDDTTTKFEGTWNKQGDSYQVIFNGNNYLAKNSGENSGKGTFTFIGTDLTLDYTHYWDNGNWITESGSWTCTYNFTNDDTFVLSGIGTNSAYGTYTRQ